MTGMVSGMSADAAAMRSAAGKAYATATDLADWLTQKLNMPFRDAHHVTGAIVKLAEAKGLPLDKLPLADMQTIEPRIVAEVFERLSLDKSVASRDSFGGTAPAQVKLQIAHWKEQLK
jgi:argininosuccinate lyase